MQFTMSHKVGQDYVTVQFKTMSNFNINVRKTFYDVFNAIGGKSINSANVWEFPTFTTSDIIKNIIDNTCFVCGGLMKDGQALDNTWVGSEDFGGDYGQPGTTMSKQGQPVIKQVRKCTICGHSHT
jgi:hypothetical protein